MATLVSIHEPGAESITLAIDGASFADPDTVTIDGDLGTANLFALPGLADCHAHLGMDDLGQAAGLDDAELRANTVRNAWAQVEHGVLLVCDKGSSSNVTLEILDAPPSQRPELQMAGRMIASEGGYYPGYAVEVDEEGLAAAVAAACGPHGWVKIVADWPRGRRGPQANFTPEAIAKAVDIAHAAGCRLAVHTMAPAGVEAAIAGGVDSVEHGLFMTAEDVEALAARNGCWVPTLIGAQSIIDFLEADSSGGKLLTKGLENLRGLLPVAETKEVTILAGTDLAIPHGEVAREAIRLVEFGLSPAGACRAVSTAAYAYLDVDHGFSAGFPADAVFFASDPTVDVRALAEPVLVIRRGKVIVDRRS